MSTLTSDSAPGVAIDLRAPDRSWTARLVVPSDYGPQSAGPLEGSRAAAASTSVSSPTGELDARRAVPTVRPVAMAVEVSTAERDELVLERTALIKRSFSREGLEACERSRLRYVEWQLECVERAESIEQVAAWEAMAEREERFARLVTELSKQVDRMKHTQRPGRRR